MPATGLNKLEQGHVYHGVASPLLLQNSVKTCGYRGYEFLEFWCWNLVPFLPDLGFQLLKSLWLSLTYFLFNDGPNVHYRWKIWVAGRPIQPLDSSITKSCCCNSCSKRFCIVLLKYMSSGGEHMKSSFPKRYKSILIVFMKMTFFLPRPIHFINIQFIMLKWSVGSVWTC